MTQTRLHRVGTVFEGVGILAAVVVAIPLGIALAGAPIAGLVWLLTAAVRMF